MNINRVSFGLDIKLVRLSPVLALSLLAALPGCAAPTDGADGDDPSIAADDDEGMVEEAESTLYTAPGSCTYDGTSCFRYNITFPTTSGASCLTKVFLDVKKNGESTWTNVKTSTPADGNNWQNQGRTIGDYTAHSIQSIRVRFRGSDNCRPSPWMSSPVVSKEGSGISDIVYAVSNPSYPASALLADCNVTGATIQESSTVPETVGGVQPLTDIPGMTLTADRSGLTYVTGWGAGCKYQGGDDLVNWAISPSAPLTADGRQATFAIHGYNF